MIFADIVDPMCSLERHFYAKFIIFYFFWCCVGGTCLLRLYLPVFAPTKRCEFAPTQKGNFAKKYKWSEFAPTHYFKVAYYFRVKPLEPYSLFKVFHWDLGFSLNGQQQNFQCYLDQNDFEFAYNCFSISQWSYKLKVHKWLMGRQGQRLKSINLLD